MKRYLKIILGFIAVSLLGCTSSDPAELIVGKWKFDHMEMNIPDGQDNFKNNAAIAIAEMQFSKVTMQYFVDGTYESSMIDGQGSASHGKYWFESDNKYICTKKDNSENEKRTQIIRISSDTLVIGDDEGAIVMIKAK